MDSNGLAFGFDNEVLDAHLGEGFEALIQLSADIRDRGYRELDQYLHSLEGYSITFNTLKTYKDWIISAAFDQKEDYLCRYAYFCNNAFAYIIYNWVAEKALEENCVPMAFHYLQKANPPMQRLCQEIILKAGEYVHNEVCVETFFYIMVKSAEMLDWKKPCSFRLFNNEAQVNRYMRMVTPVGHEGVREAFDRLASERKPRSTVFISKEEPKLTMGRDLMPPSTIVVDDAFEVVTNPQAAIVVDRLPNQESLVADPKPSFLDKFKGLFN